jgi:hypothetical protein
VTVGLLGRTDRGFNLGRVAVAFPTDATHFETWTGRTYQLWYAYGAEARWASPYHAEFWAEAMHGGLEANLVDGDRGIWAVTAADSSGVTGYDLVELKSANDRTVRLDDSRRFQVGGRWSPSHGDITLASSFEYQDRQLQSTPRGQERLPFFGRDKMRTLHLRWDRNWRYYLNREVKTGLDVEYTDFDYASGLGQDWRLQFWFPAGNFWLEQQGDLVRYDRMVMLGGNNVWSIRPELEVPIDPAHAFTAKWLGRFNMTALDKRAKYAESIFQVGRDLSPALRVDMDTRWVKYDDPGLQLSGGYVSHFLELTYRYAPGISIALSYGVDPWVIDPATNEYEYIGRDRYLFDHGADAAAAQVNNLGLRTLIPGAERALRDARVIQVEGVVRF